MAAPSAVDECEVTKTADGWCWGSTNHPMGPIGNFFVVGEDDVWASSSTAALSHWDGQRWNPVKVGDELKYVWGFSGTNLWAGGALLHPNANPTGVIYHYDGTTWTKVSEFSEEINRIWGVAPNDLWAAGWHNGTWHWDGTSWTQVGTITPITGGPADDLDGTASNDVWRITDRGGGEHVTHWDGTQWTKMDPPPELDYIGVETVRALSKTDVWFGGTARLLRYNGRTWSQVQLPGMPVDGHWSVSTIKGTARDLYFGVRSTDINGGDGALFHWNGIKVERITLPESPESSTRTVQTLERTPRGALWLARNSGDIYRRTGGVFTRTTSGPQIDFRTAVNNGNALVAGGESRYVAFFDHGVWSSRLADPTYRATGLAIPQPGITLAASATSFIRFDGSGEAQSTQPFGTAIESARSVGAASPDDVWVLRTDGLWHLLGSTWSRVNRPPLGNGYVSKIYVPPSGEVYAVTSGGVFQFDGAFWSEIWAHDTDELIKAPDGSLWGVRGWDDSRSTAFIHDGQLVPTGDPNMDIASQYVQSLAACPDGRIYAAKPWDDTLLVYDHGTWKQEYTGNTWRVDVHAVTCTSDNTVWAFGDGGLIFKKLAPSPAR